MKLYDVPFYKDRRVSTRSADREAWYSDGRVILRKSAVTPECLARFSAPGCEPKPKLWNAYVNDDARVAYTFIGVQERPDLAHFPVARVYRSPSGMTRLVDPVCDPPDVLYSAECPPDGSPGSLCWDAQDPEKARYCVLPACLTLERYTVQAGDAGVLVANVKEQELDPVEMQRIRRRRRTRHAFVS